MRIIAGTFRGRRFNPPLDKWKTRPTTDRAREAIFNILHNQYDFEGKKVLDLFAGTGGIGFEFLSRGVEEVVFVESNRACCKFIESTAKQLGVEDQTTVLCAKVEAYLRSVSGSYDFIFMDPPYAMSNYGEIIDIILSSGLLESEGLLIVEHDRSNDFSRYDTLTDHRKYGDSQFSFFGG